jgi:hypothetical protein
MLRQPGTTHCCECHKPSRPRDPRLPPFCGRKAAAAPFQLEGDQDGGEACTCHRHCRVSAPLAEAWLISLKNIRKPKIHVFSSNNNKITSGISVWAKIEIDFAGSSAKPILLPPELSDPLNSVERMLSRMHPVPSRCVSLLAQETEQTRRGRNLSMKRCFEGSRLFQRQESLDCSD